MVRASNVGRVLALLVLAAAGAAISNLAASTQRKLAWVGHYPQALKVEPAAPTDVFTDAPDQLWSDVLRRKGGPFSVLALMPDDPRVN